jgi:hypothetical protein
MSTPQEGSASSRKAVLDLIATVLLALATVATAWSGYQARWWTGEQAQAYSRANAARLESTRASAMANLQSQIDVATFMQWADAYAGQQTELAAFYRKRFRAEFKPAVEAWIASRPLKNPGAALTPFAMPQYRLAATAEATRLEAKATASAGEANANNQRADNYMLAVVLFASSLFFAGLSTRMRTAVSATALLALGSVMFVGTLTWIATFPISVST